VVWESTFTFSLWKMTKSQHESTSSRPDAAIGA
jgi:hypothetical protein